MTSYQLSIIEWEGQKCAKLETGERFFVWDNEADAHDIMLKALMELERVTKGKS